MESYVIIPTYNERGNIGPILEQIFSVVPETYILVVDDNSPDGTQEVVRELQTRYPKLWLLARPEKLGLGKAYVNAFNYLKEKECEGVFVTMDADFSHDPAALPGLLAAAENHGLVIGSRYVRGGSIVHWEFWRRFLSYGANFYYRIITRIPVKDLTTGYTAMQSRALWQLDLSSLNASGYAFLFEFKYRSWKSGVPLIEIPITFSERRLGNSKVSMHIIYENFIVPWRLLLKN